MKQFFYVQGWVYTLRVCKAGQNTLQLNFSHFVKMHLFLAYYCLCIQSRQAVQGACGLAVDKSFKAYNNLYSKRRQYNLHREIVYYSKNTTFSIEGEKKSFYVCTRKRVWAYDRPPPKIISLCMRRRAF